MGFAALLPYLVFQWVSAGALARALAGARVIAQGLDGGEGYRVLERREPGIFSGGASILPERFQGEGYTLFDFYFENSSMEPIRRPANALCSFLMIVEEDDRKCAIHAFALYQRHADVGAVVKEIRSALQGAADASVVISGGAREIAEEGWGERLLLIDKGSSLVVDDVDTATRALVTWCGSVVPDLLETDEIDMRPGVSAFVQSLGNALKQGAFIDATVGDVIHSQLDPFVGSEAEQRGRYLARVGNGWIQRLCVAFLSLVLFLASVRRFYSVKVLATGADGLLQRAQAVALQSIPALGLIGTIMGASSSVSALSQMVDSAIFRQQSSTADVTAGLGVAFDTTLFASIVWVVGGLIVSLLAPDD